MIIYNGELYHYGIKRRSGRYPYGSGERSFQDLEPRHTDDMIAEYNRLAIDRYNETAAAIENALSSIGTSLVFAGGATAVSLAGLPTAALALPIVISLLAGYGIRKAFRKGIQKRQP